MGTIGVLAFVVGAILIVLPVLTFTRLLRLESDIHQLRGRVRRLEGAAPAPPETPRTGSMPVFAPPPAAEKTTPSSVRPDGDVWTALADEAKALNLEERIGGRWLRHVGMPVLVLGVAFFLRSHVDHAADRVVSLSADRWHGDSQAARSLIRRSTRRRRRSPASPPTSSAAPLAGRRCRSGPPASGK